MRTISPDPSPDPAGHSITHWLGLFKAGQASALGPLWRRYYDRLAARAAAALPPAGDVGGEDVAASAFVGFVFGVANQQFPKLDDRHDLWRLLVTITDRKVIDVPRRRAAAKRGGGHRAADPAFLDAVPAADSPPDVALLIDDQYHHLLGQLDEELRKIAVWRLEGYSNGEIARMIGRSLRTVTNKLDLIRKIWSAETPP